VCTPIEDLPQKKKLGPTGPILFHRPCPAADVQDAVITLPDPTHSGKKFAEQFTTFYKEFRPTGPEIQRLLARKLKAADLQKVAASIPRPEMRRTNLEWAVVASANYVTAITTLTDAIKAAFPTKVDMSKVAAIK